METINWMGTNNMNNKKKKNKNMKTSSNFNFMSGGTNYISTPSKQIKNVPFLSAGLSKYKQIQKTYNNKPTNKVVKIAMFNSVLSPSPMFQKESIKSKHLSKWGDADLDGSPNWLDCDPRNVRKDKKKIKKTHIAIYGPEIYKSPQSMLQKIRGLTKKKQSTSKMFIERDVKNLTKESEEKKYIRGLKGLEIEKLALYNEEARKKEMKRLQKEKGMVFNESDLKNIQKKEETLNLLNLSTEDKNKLLNKEIEKSTLYEANKPIEEDKYRKDIETREQLEKESQKKYGLKGRLKLKQYQVQEQIKAGYSISQRELRNLKKLEKQSALKTRVGKGISEVMGVSPIPTNAVIAKGGEYTREAKAKSARIKRMVHKGVSSAFGDTMFQTGGFGSEQSFRSKGRPSGPSGRYSIKGRPVYEQEYQDYMAKQNAMNRMLPSETQQAPLNPEFVQYQLSQQSQGGDVTPQEQPQPQMEDMSNPNIAPEMMPQTEQQQRFRQGPTMDEIKMAQQMAQQQDNVLNAPQIMGGDDARANNIMIDNSGRNILKAPRIYSGEMKLPEKIKTQLKNVDAGIFNKYETKILDAPDVFKGQMRNVVQGGKDIPTVHLGERPQGNIYGDTYMDIEIGSNKPVIKKRTSEKWMTGESL
jgi:hypothetical protein